MSGTDGSPSMASEPGGVGYLAKPSEQKVPPFRVVFIIVAICAVLLGSCYAYLRATTCFTETNRRMRDLSGLDFEIVTTYCSGFEKSEHTKVYVSKKGSATRSLLLEYDPIYWMSLPSISVPTAERIVIEVPAVFQVFSRRRQWRGMRIEHDIGQIDYPSSEINLDDSE